MITRFCLLVSILLFCMNETIHADTTENSIDLTSLEVGKNSNAALEKVGVFGKKLAKKHELQYLSRDIGKIVDSRRVAWDLNFAAYNALTIEQARPWLAPIIQEFVNLIYRDPLFARSYKATHLFKNPFPGYSELTPDKLGMKITFWDAEINRPVPPYLSQIKVLEGRVEYYYSNPDQTLQKQPITETLEQIGVETPHASF